MGFTSGDELAALSHAHRNRGPTEGQKTGSEVQSERDIKVPGHCLVHNCFFFFLVWMHYFSMLTNYMFMFLLEGCIFPPSGNPKFEILYLGESREVKIYCLS